MRTRFTSVVRGVAVLSPFAFIVVFASSVAAQPAPIPVRVRQADDGSLYVVQGTHSWTLVPDCSTRTRVGRSTSESVSRTANASAVVR